MDHHMVQALIHAWNPDALAFMIGRREVQFSNFDVALLTGSLQGGTTQTHEESDVESASSIAKRVTNNPRTRHPSLLQISPYVNPITKVYKTRRRARSHPLHDDDLAEVEGDQGRQRTEVRNFYCHNTKCLHFLICRPPTIDHDMMLHYADDPRCWSTNCP